MLKTNANQCKYVIISDTLAIFEECKHFFEAAAKIVFSLKPQFQVMVVQIYDALGTIIKIVKKLCPLRERGVIYRRALRNIEKVDESK